MGILVKKGVENKGFPWQAKAGKRHVSDFLNLENLKNTNLQGCFSFNIHVYIYII